MVLRTKTGLTSLPIWRDANQFLLAIEKVVKLFPRYHKYTLGSELRQNALKVCNLIHQAWQERTKQCEYLQQLKYCEAFAREGRDTQNLTPVRGKSRKKKEMKCD